MCVTSDVTARSAPPMRRVVRQRSPTAWGRLTLHAAVDHPACHSAKRVGSVT